MPMIQGEALVTVLEVREGLVMRRLAGHLHLETVAVLKAAARRAIARGYGLMLLDMRGVEVVGTSDLDAPKPEPNREGTP